MSLQQKFAEQQLANGYEIVNGVEMHAENVEQLIFGLHHVTIMDLPAGRTGDR